MKKIKHLTLVILLSISSTAFSATEEDEIPDLKKADACFRIVEDGIKLSTQLDAEQKKLKPKFQSLSMWKKKIDKETKGLNNEPGNRLDRLNLDIKKYKKSESELKLEEFSFNQKMGQLSKNKEQNLKLSCNQVKFTEDAVEQLCHIGKKYPLACAEVLKNEK